MIGTWLQTGGFIAIGLFGAVTLTQPAVTAWVFAGLNLIATLTSLFFEKRSFCRYLCPMGGYIGWYALLAPLKVRVKDRSICSAHREKSWIHGNQNGCGCQWMVSPMSLKDNSRCGMCMDRISTCTRTNVSSKCQAVWQRPYPLTAAPGRCNFGLCVISQCGCFQCCFFRPLG